MQTPNASDTNDSRADRIRFRDSNGNEVILNTQAIAFAVWAQLPSKGPNGQPVNIIGKHTVAIFIRGAAQPILVHTEDAKAVWRFIFSGACDCVYDAAHCEDPGAGGRTLKL